MKKKMKASSLANKLINVIGKQKMKFIKKKCGGLLNVLEAEADKFRIIRVPKDDYVELKEKVDYNKDLAINDAKEIVTLLEKTKSLWSEESNLSPKGFTNATPAVWALPDYFTRLYSNAEQSALSLKNAITEDDLDDTVIAMCNLGKACGTCHANFRRLLTSQLANEVSGWSGKYVKNCQ